MPILDMKEFQNYKKHKIIEKYNEKYEKPTLYIITDDVDDRVKTYMKSKLKMAQELGIRAEKKIVKTVEELEALSQQVNMEDIYCICQLPIAKELEEYYKNNIYLFNDVDGMKALDTSLIQNSYYNIPATPKGIMEHIKFNNISLRGKNVVIMGRGELVGKPLSILMINEGATVSILTSKTDIQFKKLVLKEADIVICATGVKGSVKTSELSDTKKVIVYNVGTCFENNKLTTELLIDIDKSNIFYTDRIGAVGVCTVLSLFDNLVSSAIWD